MESKLITQAATEIWKQLHSFPWFSSVGIGEEDEKPVLIVYSARNVRGNDLKRIPTEYGGIRVVRKTIGRVNPSSPRNRKRMHRLL
jgi:hypothetical protein